MTKITVDIYEHFDGSDDPRAIEGGGGAGSRWIERKTNSKWLIDRYIQAMSNCYQEVYTFKRVS